MADKIVSWGGIDSKGTSGMGVTGSLAVSGSATITNGATVYNGIQINTSNFPSLSLYDSLQDYSWLVYANGTNFFIRDNGGNNVFSITPNRNITIGPGTSDAARLTVKGSGTTSSTKSLLVQDSAGSAILEAYDSGYVVVRQEKGINLASSINEWDNIKSIANSSLTLNPYWGVKVNGTYPSGVDTANIPLLHVTRTLAGPLSPLVKFEDSGSTRFIVTNSGSVGIGTVTPIYNLEVSSTSVYGTGFGIMSGANSGAEIGFQNRGYALPRWTIRATSAADGSSGDLTFQRLASTFPVTITSNENLLVGTSIDSARLTVKGSGTTSSTTALLVQNANASASMVVLDNGNVGIGVTTPTAQIHIASQGTGTYLVKAPGINGNPQFEIYRPTDNTTAIKWYDTGATTQGIIDNVSSNTMTMTGNWAIANDGSSLFSTYAGYTKPAIDLYTYVYQYDFNTPLIRARVNTSNIVSNTIFQVNQNGNGYFSGSVGIGTSTPSASLHVAGNTIITGSLTVSSTTVGAAENTLTLGLAPAGGAGEGGQLGFNATGGTYTSASFIDLWQNKLRVLKGTNAGSTAEVANFDLQTLYLNLPGGAVTMPQRPAFRVTGSSGYNPTSGTVISGSSVGIDYNQGSYYNNTNGQFTCPVAGLYHVWYVGRTYAASLASVALYKNNTGTPLAFWESNANSGHFGTSAVVSLAVNDVITAKVTAGQVTFDGNDNWGAAYIG